MNKDIYMPLQNIILIFIEIRKLQIFRLKKASPKSASPLVLKWIAEIRL